MRYTSFIMETTENESSSNPATNTFGTNSDFQRMMDQYVGRTSFQSSASNFGGGVGIQQLPTDANSQLLEQMNTLGGFSGGGNSSTGNNPFVTTANPLSVNTTVNKMTGRPEKKRKVQFEELQSQFSFNNYQEDGRLMAKNTGTERLDLGAAKADTWTSEASQIYDLVRLLFPDSQKPDSESVANAVDAMLTAQFLFEQSTDRNAAFPFAASGGENVQLA